MVFEWNNPYLPTSELQDTLEFDSKFEGGNLDAAIKVSNTEYDLFMRADTNTKGHSHWFNFKIKKMKKNVIYKFKICNFTKKKCLFARGMRPYIYSLM